MSRSKRIQPTQLEELPSIGKSIAADLRRVGILKPDQLAEREPIAVFRALSKVMGHRHDPCVLYTLMSAKHFLECGEAVPWWKFTAEGKNLLKSSDKYIKVIEIKDKDNEQQNESSSTF